MKEQQEQQQQEEDSEEIPPKEWKKLIGSYWFMQNVDIEKFKKHFLEHPKKERFINWKKDGNIDDGMTMLISAIEYSRLDIAKVLLDHGADVNIANKDGYTALMEASKKGHNEAVKLLLEKGSDITTADKFRYTALMYASREGYNKTVELLLGKGADITAASNEGETALTLASRFGRSETVKILLENGADPTVFDKNGETGLIHASRNRYNETLKLLLENGGDVTTANNDGYTALMYASREGYDETVGLLLEKGADITVPNKNGETALTLAFDKGHLVVLLKLLEKDPNISNSSGQTVLHLTCLQNKKAYVQKLLEAGIDKDKLDNDGFTALFYAAEQGYADIVDLLMKQNVNCDKTDERTIVYCGDDSSDESGYSVPYYQVKDGRTPLFVAAQNGHQNVVALLLQHGADPYLCNHKNMIPRDVSKVHGPIQQLFRIHDFFDKRDKGGEYEEEYITCSKWDTDDKKPAPPLEDIIHDIVKYPHFAGKFFELYQENREIVNWLDEDGRTVRQVACKECREVTLFMGRYDMDKQPMYESSTCKVYRALDYGRQDEKQPRAVAMKMMENEEHYLNEIGARRKDDGSPRFSSEFVTPYLAAYRADENPEFAKAGKAWNANGSEEEILYYFFISMELGGRNLMESMNAENLSAEHKDLQRREILLTLVKIFSYLHEVGYIHGDIKPHNVVRHVVDSVTSWKAIDFDACTKIGDVVGLKLTTGSAPPEMTKIVNGEDTSLDSESKGNSKVILRQPGGDLDKADLVLADPSFDVWSFGILMYQLVTGRSFFHSDLQGNVDEAGLQDLANLTQGRINKRLESVKDANARVLLSRILRLDPKERPTMSEIGEDYYFRPSDAPQGRKAEFFGKQVLATDPKIEEKVPPSALETSQMSKAVEDDEESETMEDIERSLVASSKSDFSYFKLRDEDKDWSDKLLNSEVEKFHFDKLGGMGEKPRLIDGDTIYQSTFLRSLLSSKGPDYFMGFLVEYFELYEIMDDAHEVCQGIKANLVSNAKDLKGIFIKLFVRGKGLNDVVRGTLFCNSIDQFKYVGRQLRERYRRNVYIKPPKKETGAWPIPKLLIYSNKRFQGRCMSVEIQFSTVYMHLATQASNNHLVYEAIRESTGYLGDKDKEFQQFLQTLNEQYIDTEGFLQNERAREGRFEIVVEQAEENYNAETQLQEPEKQYTTKSTGFITSGRICCGDQKFQFMPPTDRFQQFSESSFVVNKSLTLLSSHSYWSEESYDLEGKCVEFVVSFKGRGLAIAGIGTDKCWHGSTESGGGGTRCSVHVGRSKFVVRKSGINEVFREKKLPNQERAKICFHMQGGALVVSFVGSEREDEEEILEIVQVSMPSDHQRYYLYMRAPAGVHDIKFHDINQL